MLWRIGIGLVCAIAGYVIGAFGGGYLVSQVSTNSHDGNVEAAMTGAFVTGPLVAIISLIVGLILSRKSA